MKNKFESKNEEEKLFKKRLLDRTLYENTEPNLCFSVYIKSHFTFLGNCPPTPPQSQHKYLLLT